MSLKKSNGCPECGSSSRFSEDDDTTLVSCNDCGAWYYHWPYGGTLS